MKKSSEERFWQYVMPEPNSGCWLWTGPIEKLGYSSLRIDGVPKKAHRYSYVLHKGPIPEGLEIDHRCRVKCCVNPNHLDAVTHVENMRRHFSQKTHCKNGHPLTQVSKRSRGCRLCAAASGRKNWAIRMGKKHVRRWSRGGTTKQQQYNRLYYLARKRKQTDA